MGIKIKMVRSGDWVEGTVNGYKFQAKVFSEPSDFGINEGRVSKLSIWPEDKPWADYIVNYERGWEKRPKSKEEKAIFKALLGQLELLRGR